MKAAVMRAIGEPLCIEDIRIDTPGAREVIVRTAWRTVGGNPIASKA